MPVSIGTTVAMSEQTTYLWETLGSSQTLVLPQDEVDIVELIVQDNEMGREFLTTLYGLKVGQHTIVNIHDPQYIERWTRTS